MGLRTRGLCRKQQPERECLGFHRKGYPRLFVELSSFSKNGKRSSSKTFLRPRLFSGPFFLSTPNAPKTISLVKILALLVGS